MWLNQQTLQTKQCKLIIHNRLEDIAMQKWGNDMSTSSMCSGYKMFKKQLEFEKISPESKLWRKNCNV